MQTRLENATTYGHNINRIAFSRPDSAPKIQAKLTIGQPGDKYEQEADDTARQVVQRIHQQSNQPVQREAVTEEEEFANPTGDNIQRQSSEEEELQTKLIDNIQRQSSEEEELQMKSMVQRVADGGMAASADVEAGIQSARGGGQPLANSIREPMEQAFGADFSGVRVHTDSQADQLNQSVQAKAFTTGQDVFFRQEAYEPGSRGGQELLAHELTHVVQQGGEKVRRSPESQENVYRGQSVMETPSAVHKQKVKTRFYDIVPEKVIQRLPVVFRYNNGYVARIETDELPTEQLLDQIDHPTLAKESKEDILMALWERGIKVNINKNETSKLNPLSNLPDFPKQYIRINSFAFAKSKKIPIASISFATCLGVVIHDHQQKLGGMAHIDTDALETLSDKTQLVTQSVLAMIDSINTKNSSDLEINLFAGTGLADNDGDFSEFLKKFTSTLETKGINKKQINSVLNTKDSARLAVYFPEQGSLYLKNDFKESNTIMNSSIKREEYDSFDYEDQEDVQTKITEGNSIIIEIEFDEQGQEIAHTEYSSPSGEMGNFQKTKDLVQKNQIH